MTQPTFHQPTTGTAASLVATCTICGRGITRQNGGSALWIDAEGKTACTVKTASYAVHRASNGDYRVTFGGRQGALNRNFGKRRAEAQRFAEAKNKKAGA